MPLRRFSRRALERLVLRSPHPIRVLLSNVVALRLDRARRRGEAYLRGKGLVEDYHRLDRALLAEQQAHLLRTFLWQVRKEIPFYRERIPNSLSGDPGVLLRSIPVLTKGEARAAGESILNRSRVRKRHYVGHTSGSTGTPFTFRLTIDALRMRFGLRDGFSSLHGCDFREMNLRLGGRLFVSADRDRPPFWVRDRAANQLLFSVYHLGEKNMPEFVKALERYKPRFVTGYPSAVHILAQGCRLLGSSYRPTAVLTDSETVLDYQREEVRRAWDCEIHDYYGMEVGWVAGQCSLGKYHLSPLTSVVELLDEQGDPVPPGKLGELVVTDLTNPLMPLIRYRTGDMGVWAPDTCSCGWHTPALERIEGRRDDVVILPDGRRIGRLDHVLKGARGIVEAQLVQETSVRFVMYVVPGPGYSPDVERSLAHEMELRLGSGLDISVTVVDKLQKTRSGKLRSVVSLVMDSAEKMSGAYQRGERRA